MFFYGCSLPTVRIAVRKRRDSKAIEKEVDNDFKEEFEQKTVNELSGRGMSDLVDWMEDDLRERKLEQSEEIESFNELK